MEARALSTLVEEVLARAWRRDSEWHGEHHWRCVTATGLELADGLDGADRLVVFCFGLLHDTRRENETYDPRHGQRAADLAALLRAEGALALEDRRFDVLAGALRLHSDGQVTADPTMGTCWDADRLHLPRVGITPNPDLFSTAAASGRGRIATAEALRKDGPPDWDELWADVFRSGAPEAID